MGRAEPRRGPRAVVGELTLGELRRALTSGAANQTVAQALAALDAADETARQHERTTAAYGAYVQDRAQRLSAAEQEAMDEVDRAHQQTGRPWSTPEARPRARRAAGLAARERFLNFEPLLEFADWVAAGSPRSTS